MSDLTAAGSIRATLINAGNPTVFIRADALKLSAGAGFSGDVGSLRGQFDYAYTDGGFLGAVHRVSLGVRF